MPQTARLNAQHLQILCRRLNLLANRKAGPHNYIRHRGTPVISADVALFVTPPATRP
jgi:hypothetical protein